MDVVEGITDRHAVINNNKQASIVLPGESVLLLELVPVLFASYAANEAEKAVPGNRQQALTRYLLKCPLRASNQKFPHRGMPGMP